MSNTSPTTCAFCNSESDRFCPIAGKRICGTTCLEVSLWADELKENGEELHLEFTDAIRSHSRVVLDLMEDVEIAEKCIGCAYHWKDEASGKGTGADPV